MTTPSHPYTITSADPEKDRLPIAHLLSETFADGKYVEEICQSYIGNCHYDWETTRLIWDGDQLIHHWGVWGYRMRLESVELQIAGIGAVTTREPYRQQGLMARAAVDSFDAMEFNGYHLSILRGRHYVKFGYARAWNYITYKLKPDEFPPFEIKQSHQPLDQHYFDQVVALYNATHAGLTGTACRPTYRIMADGESSGYHGWMDGSGDLAGYVRALPSEDQSSLQCLEAAGDPVKGLAVLNDLMEAGEFDRLEFFTLHHDHPILQDLRRSACLVENRYFLDTGWRVKVINLKSCLEALTPLFEVRLHKSHLANWSGDLLIDAGDQQNNLQIEAGKVQIGPARPGEHRLQGGAAMGRFIMGSDNPKEIIQQERLYCNGITAELVTILFPNLHPMLSHRDEF